MAPSYSSLLYSYLPSVASLLSKRAEDGGALLIQLQRIDTAATKIEPIQISLPSRLLGLFKYISSLLPSFSARRLLLLVLLAASLIHYRFVQCAPPTLLFRPMAKSKRIRNELRMEKHAAEDEEKKSDGDGFGAQHSPAAGRFNPLTAFRKSGKKRLSTISERKSDTAHHPYAAKLLKSCPVLWNYSLWKKYEKTTNTANANAKASPSAFASSSALSKGKSASHAADHEPEHEHHGKSKARVGWLAAFFRYWHFLRTSPSIYRPLIPFPSCASGTLSSLFAFIAYSIPQCALTLLSYVLPQSFLSLLPQLVHGVPAIFSFLSAAFSCIAAIFYFPSVLFHRYSIHTRDKGTIALDFVFPRHVKSEKKKKKEVREKLKQLQQFMDRQYQKNRQIEKSSRSEEGSSTPAHLSSIATQYAGSNPPSQPFARSESDGSLPSQESSSGGAISGSKSFSNLLSSYETAAADESISPPVVIIFPAFYSSSSSYHFHNLLYVFRELLRWPVAIFLPRGCGDPIHDLRRRVHHHRKTAREEEEDDTTDKQDYEEGEEDIGQDEFANGDNICTDSSCVYCSVRSHCDVDHFGMSNSLLTSPRVAHLHDDCDIDAALAVIRTFFPHSAILGLGYGGGANYFTRYVSKKCKRGERVKNLVSMASISCPYDLLSMSFFLQYKRPWLDWMLTKQCQKLLKRNHHLFASIQAQHNSQHHPDDSFHVSSASPAAAGADYDTDYDFVHHGIDMRHALTCNSWRDILSCIDLPLFAPTSALCTSTPSALNEYLQNASALHSLPYLSYPLLSISALDDPLLPPSVLPHTSKSSAAAINSSVFSTVVYENPFICHATTRYGGHAAFMSPLLSYFTAAISSWIFPYSGLAATNGNNFTRPPHAHGSAASSAASQRCEHPNFSQSYSAHMSASLESKESPLPRPHSHEDTDAGLQLSEEIASVLQYFERERVKESQRVFSFFSSSEYFRLSWCDRAILQWFHSSMTIYRKRIFRAIMKKMQTKPQPVQIQRTPQAPLVGHVHQSLISRNSLPPGEWLD